MARGAMVFDVEDARRVVGPLQKSPQTDEVHGIVAQHGAQGDAAREMGAKFHPFEKAAGVGLGAATGQALLQVQPGLVLDFPHFGGECAAHGTGVFARRAQAGGDGGGIVRVARHEVDDLARFDLAMAPLESVAELGNAEHGAPAAGGIGGRLGQERGLHVHVEHAGSVFSALGVARHPVQVIGGAA